MGFGRNGYYSIAQGDESTKIYADWSGYKGETGDQGFGISSLDVMFLVTDVFNGNNAAYDGANVDWTNLSEVAIPTATTNTTAWTKAVNFSGGNSHLAKTGSWNGASPLLMDGNSMEIAPPGTAGNTASSSLATPWATAIVFNIDNVSQEQYLWCIGGFNTGDNNVYLKLNASKQLIFGWGKEGTGFNECMIHPTPSAPNGYLGHNAWYGVYIGFNGTRLKWNASAANLADCFDIRLMNSASNNWTIGSNLSVTAAWYSSGQRMDHSITGWFTVGGRGTNKTFQGEVASMVVTTLRLGVAMPTSTEIDLMIRDPKKWEADYRVNQTVRRSSGATDGTYNPNDIYYGYGGTHIYLMGDGTNDAYGPSTGIRNQVQPNDISYTRLIMTNMVSNDIVNVTIPGLS